MAKSNRTLCTEFTSFSGINIPEIHSGKASIKALENFQIESDGSIKKRSGFRHRFHFAEGEIKNVWSGRIKGQFKCYLLIGKQIYAFHPEENTYSQLGEISTSDSDISFFFFENTLYLKDSEHFYRINDLGLTPVIGYVPLYGKDWPTTYAGEIYEPLNLMHRKARISYLTGFPNTSMLPTVHPVKSILAVYRNGKKLADDAYIFDTNFNVISINGGVNDGERFLVCVEFDELDEPLRDMLGECQYSKLIGSADTQRIAAWGANSDKSYMFLSSHISSEDYEESEKYFPDHGTFYFKAKNSFHAGDGSKGITSVVESSDKLLVFTEDELWTSSSAISADDTIPLVNTNPIFGCSSFYGTSIAENDPIAVSYRGIMRWSSNDKNTSGFTASNVSAPVSHELSPSFLQRARVYANREKNQLWFFEPHASGIVWIYSVDKKSWFKFTGLKNASGFFELEGKTAFFCGNDFFIFSDELSYDCDESENIYPIVAKFESGILDFESKGQKKLLSCELSADVKDEALEIIVHCDTGEQISFTPHPCSDHSLFNVRLHSSRFSTAVISIVSRGQNSQVIHGISLKAKEKSTI